MVVKVTCQIDTYNEPAKENIKIHNHWNRNEMVELEINNQRYTVLAKELKAAIDNCTNTAKF